MVVMSMKELRTRKNLTQAELSELARMTQQAVSDYETGRRDISHMELGTAYRLSKALQVPMDQLMTYKGNLVEQ
jgi:transcriptional regulator with XRE-family HTH domain